MSQKLSNDVMMLWQEIRSLLYLELESVETEIRTYSKPIPTCDLQFNFLLEKRAEVSRALVRMHKIHHRGLSEKALTTLVDEFLALGAIFDEKEKDNVRSLVKGCRVET